MPVERWGDDAYALHDAERLLHEPPKNAQRTSFRRDRARILHSSMLRRLGAKTQVLGPASDDFVRTRLTHSLEVAQVGRELGDSLGCNPDVVETACLAHDLGHPPFGHNGERALAEVADGIGGFEGNAQTLRLLTRLEPKTFTDYGESVGLNLTRASLDASCKYPWPRGSAPAGSNPAKFGVYEEDLPVFRWLREGAPDGVRCLEAQVMDLSDDISYSVHDVEDAIASGHFDPGALDRHVEHVCEVARVWYGPRASAEHIGPALERLQSLPYWLRGFDSSRTDLARLKDLTSQLIGRFCAAAHDATRARYGQHRLTRYAASLVVPDETAAEITALKGIAATFVMAPRETEHPYLNQRTIVFDLVNALLESDGRLLERQFQEDYRQAFDDAGRLRAVIDQVASLSDPAANKWHSRLCGMLGGQY